MHTNFLTTVKTSLFYCCEKAFIFMNIWMIGKNLMKHHYLKNKIFTITEEWKILLMHITLTQKEFVKIFK